MISFRRSTNWLEKLHRSRGFPIDDNHALQTLDDHIKNPNPRSSTSQDDADAGARMQGKSKFFRFLSSRGEKKKEKMAKKGEDRFEVLTSVLSDLFVMREPQPTSMTMKGSKAERKQKCPRNWSISNPAVPEPEINDLVNASEFGKDFPVMVDIDPKSRKRKGKGKVVDHGSRVPAMEATEDFDMLEPELDSDSRIEVTVIDSSYSIWKSEKTISRRGSDWSVYEMKSSNSSPRDANLESRTKKTKRRLSCVADRMQQRG